MQIICGMKCQEWIGREQENQTITRGRRISAGPEIQPHGKSIMFFPDSGLAPAARPGMTEKERVIIRA
ncbi:MAG: hypothetical protein ACXWKA_03165 [Xanthobacteraceae bacterium]